MLSDCMCGLSLRADGDQKWRSEKSVPGVHILQYFELERVCTICSPVFHPKITKITH